MTDSLVTSVQYVYPPSWINRPAPLANVAISAHSA